MAFTSNWTSALLLAVAALAAPAHLEADSEFTAPVAVQQSQPPCGLNIGERVVLLVDDFGDSGLRAGSEGIVACYDSTDPNSVLVSFDNWTGGHDNFQFCLSDPASQPGPAESHWFMPCSDLGKLSDLFCGYQPGDIVRSTIPNPEGAVDLPYHSWGKVICVTEDAQAPNLLVFWNDWDNGTDDYRICLTYSGTAWTDGTSWKVRCSQVEKAPENCGFQVGDRVRARYRVIGQSEVLEDGSIGTVICVGSQNAQYTEVPVLVSWDGWTGGHGSTIACQVPPTINAPLASHFWMRCNEIELFRPAGCGLRPGDAVELVVTVPSVPDLSVGQKGKVICVNDDHANDYDVLVSWAGLTTGGDATLSLCTGLNATPGPSGSHVWMHCGDAVPAPMCGFHPGDRIVATAATVYGTNDEIHAGRGGTVVCVDAEDSSLSLLVSWDGWTGGSSSTALGSCDSNYELGEPDSHAWVRCTDVGHAESTCCGFRVGSRVVLTIADPYSANWLPLGSEGTVVCCNDNSPGDVLVNWDDWSDGFTENLDRCFDTALVDDGAGLWWTECRHLRAAPYDGWRYGDFDSDRCTGINDFLFLLDHYQTHTFIGDFLNLLDNWQMGSWCGT